MHGPTIVCLELQLKSCCFVILRDPSTCFSSVCSRFIGSSSQCVPASKTVQSAQEVDHPELHMIARQLHHIAALVSVILSTAKKSNQ